MLREFSSLILASLTLTLANCSPDQPRVIQVATNSPEIVVKVGMATQIEMPDSRHIQSVIVGNPTLLTAEKDDDVVNLTAKDGIGETNLIVRSRDQDGETKIYQYHVVVQTNGS